MFTENNTSKLLYHQYCVLIIKWFIIILRVGLSAMISEMKWVYFKS